MLQALDRDGDIGVAPAERAKVRHSVDAQITVND